MNRTIFLILFLFHLCSSTGVVWIRMSSSEDVVARIEFIDRENFTRYGISFDIQLDPNYPREFVLPLPPLSSSSDFPIFHYTIQMLKSRDGSFFGDNFETRLPILVNEPWIHNTITDSIGISIHTSIRSECLPHFHGPACQFYCAEKCPKDQCREKKCENNSQCRFDGIKPKCMCQPGYSGEFCERLTPEDPIQFSTNSSIFLLTFFILVIYLLFVSIAATIIFRHPTTLRKPNKPLDVFVEEGKSVEVSGKLQILTPPHVIFASLA